MFRKILIIIFALVLIAVFLALNRILQYKKRHEFIKNYQVEYLSEPSERVSDGNDTFFAQLAKAAEERALHSITYDPSYFKLDYPGGDVPADKGVCTDVIIRAYRKVGIDLQVKVHEDMKKNFDAYPQIWGLRKADPNIDHRRVPNLMVFFKRHGHTLAISREPGDYQPGDIITWNLSRGVTHIGIVSTKRNDSAKRYLAVHNIGSGPKLEDVLFAWKITGHFKYN